jgi:hypothetical protein
MSRPTFSACPDGTKMWVRTDRPFLETSVSRLHLQLLDMGTLAIDANYLLAGHAGGENQIA